MFSIIASRRHCPPNFDLSFTVARLTIEVYFTPVEYPRVGTRGIAELSQETFAHRSEVLIRRKTMSSKSELSEPPIFEEGREMIDPTKWGERV